MKEPTLALDWSAYDAYGAGDAYAQLPATGGGFGKAAAVCIGSRTCQRADAKSVMCPSYRATQDTTHSTQHRAATLKAALDGQLGERPFEHPQLAEAMDLCVACKGCKRDCPNGVDMALLRTEALAQRWQATGMPWRERLFATLPRWLPWLRWLKPLVALRERLPLVARLGERWLGVAAARTLPVPAPRAFLDRPAVRQNDTPTDTRVDEAAPARREVVLLVDTFSNHLDPATAEAAVAVLQAAGCQVHLLRPPQGERALCCGRSALSVGDVPRARDEALRLLAALAPFVARGLPVVGLEPSCLLMLRDEFLAMGLGEAALAASRNAWLLEEFLAREVDGGRLRMPLRRLEAQVLVHGHCHQKAFGAMKAMRKVLGWVPGLTVDVIDASCCGMAGSFGYEAEHHAMSLRMAEAALLPAVRQAAPETLLVANGTSCRHQIRDGAQREAQHFVHVLRAALA